MLKSNSKTVTDTLVGEHTHQIVGYSLIKGIGDGEPIASERFTVGGHEWVGAKRSIRVLFFVLSFCMGQLAASGLLAAQSPAWQQEPATRPRTVPCCLGALGFRRCLHAGALPCSCTTRPCPPVVSMVSTFVKLSTCMLCAVPGAGAALLPRRQAQLLL